MNVDVFSPALSQVENAMVPRPYIVRRSKRETVDTVTLELEPEDGGELPPFAPGQFNMLYVYGVGEIPISISGDPAHRTRLVHTTRDVGLVSRAVCGLKPGAIIGVRGPFGSHWPIELAEGRDVLVIAGGLGLAPLRSVIYHVLANRERCARVLLFHSAHLPENLLFRRELEQWRARFDLEVDIIVGHAHSSWKGNVGYVTTLLATAHFQPQNAIAFVCGPEVLMRSSAYELEKRGMVADDIYINMERNMKCGIGLCGHCQLGPYFMCKDGPVFRYSDLRELILREEL